MSRKKKASVKQVRIRCNFKGKSRTSKDKPIKMCEFCQFLEKQTYIYATNRDKERVLPIFGEMIANVRNQQQKKKKSCISKNQRLGVKKIVEFQHISAGPITKIILQFYDVPSILNCIILLDVVISFNFLFFCILPPLFFLSK